MMIDSFRDIELFFKELDSVICKKIKIYIIGGAVLLKRGLKAATKDIDFIVSTKDEFLEIQDKLKKMGFYPQIPGKEYLHMNLSQIFQKLDFRIDVFEKEVCGKFSLSENMKKRAEKIIDLEHITIFLCSNEDIFLFKTMTERDGDMDDCLAIASTQIPDWEIILEELNGQIEKSKQDIWITWVGDRLDVMIDRGIDIPIMGKIDKLRDEFFHEFEKKHLGFRY